MTIPDKGGPVDDGLAGRVQGGQEVVQLLLCDGLVSQGEGAQPHGRVAVNLPLSAG